MTQDEKATIASILKEHRFTHEEARTAMVDLFERGTDPSRGWISRLLANLRSGKYAEMVTPEVRQWVAAILNDTAGGSGASTQPAPAADIRETGVYQAWVPESSKPRFEVISRTYDGTMPTTSVPRFDGAWHLQGDYMIANDIHAPATNWIFAEQMIQVAEVHLSRPRKLIICGDLINGDALSRWDSMVLVTPLADELTYAEAFLNHLAETFDEIWMTRGNHESRILVSLRGQLHAPQFRRMFTDNPRVHFSMYTWLRVASGGQLFHITHQRGYSQTPLSVARKLATKHGTHVVSAHQHHSAVGMDISSRYACIDSGGLHDWRLMAYVGLEDSTSPVMCNGFTMIREGIATLFTPAEYCLTDWSMWLDTKTERKVA